MSQLFNQTCLNEGLLSDYIICIYIYIYNVGAHSVTVILDGNRHGDMSSVQILGQGCLYFTQR